MDGIAAWRGQIGLDEKHMAGPTSGSKPHDWQEMMAWLISDRPSWGSVHRFFKKKKTTTCCAVTQLQPDLEPDGVDDLAEDEEREDPESAEDGGQDEL